MASIGAFTNARRALESRIPMPDQLEVIADHTHSMFSGYYERVFDQTVNQCAVWTTQDKSAWLYSTPQGFWRVTDDPSDFQLGKGYIISRERHEGMPPNTVSVWCTNGQENHAVFVRMWSPTGASAPPAGAASGPPPTVSVMAPVEVAVRKEPHEKLSALFSPEDMQVVQVKDGPARRAGLEKYVGWTLTHLNGFPVRTVADLVEQTASKSICNLRLTAPRSTRGTAADWKGLDEVAFVQKGSNEPLGLELQDMTLLSTVHGSPAYRCGVTPLMGRRLLHVNYHEVHSRAEIQHLSKDQETVILGFERDERERAAAAAAGGVGASASPHRSPPPPLLSASNPTVEIPVLRQEGSMGMYFHIVAGQLQLSDVAPGSVAAASGLDPFVGWSLMRAGDLPVGTPEELAQAWSDTPLGGTLILKLEDRHVDRHLRVQRAYSQFVESYGENADREWALAKAATPPSYVDWEARRGEESRRAAAPGESLPPMGRDGAYTRRALGLPAAAGSASPPPRSAMRPTYLGPSKS